MRLLSRMLVVALMLLATAPAVTPVASARPQKAGKDDKMVAEAMGLNTRFADAFNARNVDAVVALYWQDPRVQLVTPDGTLAKGIDAVRASYTEFFGSVESLKIEYIESNYTAFGDVVQFTGRVRVTQKSKGAPEMTYTLKAMDLRRKVGAGWVFVYDQVSVEPAPAAARTLYQRLGGYDAIAAVIDEFIKRMATDPKMARFFGGLSQDSAGKLRQHIVNQVCAAAGGPCIYTGRDMKTSHKGLGITEDEWNIGANHLVAALDTFHVPAAEKNDLLNIVASVKGDIVEKK